MNWLNTLGFVFVVLGLLVVALFLLSFLAQIGLLGALVLIAFGAIMMFIAPAKGKFRHF